MRERFGSLFDEREAIAVDVEKSMSNAVDEEIEMARQEAAAQRRAQESARVCKLQISQSPPRLRGTVVAPSDGHGRCSACKYWSACWLAGGPRRAC